MATTKVPDSIEYPTSIVNTGEHPSSGLNIYQILDRISQEAGALAPEAKGGVPFAFRGIDGTVAHLSPLLRKYGVVIVPSVQQKSVTSAPSGNKVITTTDLTTDFTFYAPDGTYVIATTAGLANDFADRSTAQAQSVAFRVALLQTFALPTHSPEPEQTGVEPEAPTQARAQDTGPTPEEEERTKIEQGKAAIKKLAEEKGLNYLEIAREIKLPADYAGKLGELKKLYDEVAKREAAV